MSKLKSKHRPYFSTPELAEIIKCVKAISHNQTLIRYLEGYAYKIDMGLLEPNLVLKTTLIESLDLDLDSTSSNPSTNNLSERELAFNKYQSNPSSCSIKELELAHTYRYENDLMSPEEEIEFTGGY